MSEPPQGLGPATDRNNDPVTDPTANVRELVDAAMLRQDDLRKADAAMREQEGQHVRELMALRAEFAEEIRRSEADRIDAIRSVDVGAVAAAAQVAENRATALASQVAAQAEAVRTGLAAALEPIQKDVADLRRAQYEAQGQKTQVIETRSAAEDLKPFFDQLQALIVAQSGNQGATTQAAEMRASSRANLSILIAALSLIGFVIFALLR